MVNENFSQDGNSLKLDGNIIYTPRLTKGEPGEQGLKGDKGDKGDSFTYDDFTPSLLENLKGERGLKGEEGLTGKKGPQGERGDRGLSGDQGLKGEKGAKGDPGEKGLGLLPHITATATVDNTINLPHVDVIVAGTDENPILNFSFTGLVGANGLKGEDGKNGIDAPPYDDTALINQVRDLIAAEELRIKNLINQLDEEIKDDVKDMVKETEFWQENIPEGVISGNSNFGQDDVKEYLQQLGLWKTSDGATYTNWSTIRQNVDEIRSKVNQIKQTDIDYELLSSSLYNYISENQALAGMLSTWSKFLKLSDDDIQTLEWMSSGIKSSAGGNAGSESAIVDLFASARNAQTNTDAYAGLNTRVENIEGNYVSTASLTSYVENTITSSMAGVVTETTLENAISTMSAKLDNNLSGVVTRSTLDEAVAGLFAENSNSSTKASIDAVVQNGVSNITLSADKLNSVFKTVDLLVNSLEVKGDRILFTGNNASTGVILNGWVNMGKIATGMVSAGDILYLLSVDDMIIANSVDSPDYGANLYIGHTGTSPQDIYDNTSYYPFESIYQNALSLIKLKSPTIFLDGSTIQASSPITQVSDENKKNIINEINPSIEDIANTRTVDYEFKSDLGNIHSGAIALDWQKILPNTVTLNEGTLGLDYSSTALISSVVAAREIVKLKQENEKLKQRLSVIEERLDNYLNNKNNE